LTANARLRLPKAKVFAQRSVDETLSCGRPSSLPAQAMCGRMCGAECADGCAQALCGRSVQTDVRAKRRLQRGTSSMLARRTNPDELLLEILVVLHQLPYSRAELGLNLAQPFATCSCSLKRQSNAWRHAINIVRSRRCAAPRDWRGRPWDNPEMRSASVADRSC